MKMFIPEIGTKIQLTENWNFTICSENANKSIIKKMAMPIDLSIARIRDYLLKQNRITQEEYDSNPYEINISLEKGTVLCIEKVNLRRAKGLYKTEYDSVSFRIPKKCGNPKQIESARFRVNLSDVNKINFKLYEDD